MRTSHFLTSLSIGAALTACSSSPDPDPQPPALASSFEVTATLAFPAGTDPDGLPDSERLVLHLADAPSGSVTAVWGASIGSDSGSFERTDTGLSLRGSVALQVEAMEPFTFDATVSFESVDLVLLDGDEDGEVDAVEGTGSGTFSHVVGDVQQDLPFTVTFSGTPDTTPPEIAIDGNPDSLNVLDRFRIVASEPLHPDTKAVLWYRDSRIVLEPFPGDGTYVRSFATGAILPFGTELRVEFEPAARDMAGLSSENPPMLVQTMAGPGVFAEDGFEGELAAVSGGAEVVTGVGTLPAIAGTRSLLVEPGDTLTMRVPLIGGETHLRFQVRMLSDGSGYGGCSQLGVRAGFPGLDAASDVREISVLSPDGPDENTGDEVWIAAGPIFDVELALPAGVAGEVIFDVFPEARLPGPPCSTAAMLIDDLRAE
jgi:hypothetical protein